MKLKWSHQLPQRFWDIYAFVAISLFMVVLAMFIVDIATHGRSDATAVYTPIIDWQGIDANQYSRDVHECNSYVHKKAGFADTTHRSRRDHAVIVKNCMAGRSYKVLQ